MKLIEGLAKSFSDAYFKCDAGRLCSSMINKRNNITPELIKRCRNIDGDGANLPLEVAVIMRNAKAVEGLLDAGASTEIVSPYSGVKPLELAINWRFDEGAALLVRKGADIEEPCKFDAYSKFHMALMYSVGIKKDTYHGSKSPSLFPTVLEETGDNNGSMNILFEECVAYKEEARTYLYERASHDLLEAFIERGVDLNKPDAFLGVTPLETVAYGVQDNFFIERTSNLLFNHGALVTDKVMDILQNRGDAQLQQHFRRARVEQERAAARKPRMVI